LLADKVVRAFQFALVWLGNFKTSSCLVGRLTCAPVTTRLTPQLVGISVTYQQPTAVCIACCERSFGKLKLNILYLRASMTNNKSGQVLLSSFDENRKGWKSERLKS